MNRTPVADWQQLSALYELADTLEPTALADWLAQLRKEAHPLLAQLEQMLSARSQVQHNDFLATPPRLPPPVEPRAIVWQAGSRIGPYRLVSRLGSGGMAEVWLAQRDDGAFQRQVAIKLLFRNQASDALDTFAQRFNRERDILASLDHPHIAGLHDAGVTPTGQPWLALEYVEGETLTAWCDAQCSTIEARVRLFRQVLLAVQHAHANLVIHRDLKPGNILVTAQGEVRLLDFGIAKLMESEGATSVETELTRLAGRPMTLNYAAPEQLLGQPLTTACDVYSLGVVLYELLCGERPYELKVASAAQLEQAILDLDPRAPSRRALSEGIANSRSTTRVALRKQLGSDLDAIVLRALAKQPGQRYGSVEALGIDLDRWLDGEPVEARAPSTVYRVGKFVRRHTLSVSLGVAAVVALVGVTIVAVVMGLQAREDSARAVAARDFMLNIFQRANQEKSRGVDITARDLLETGRRDVITRLVGQPELQAELLRGIAKVQTDMGEYVTADGTFADLVRLRASLHDPRAEALARADHAFNAVQMNNLLLAARLFDESRAVRGAPIKDAELSARLAEVSGWIALNGGNAQRARELLAVGRSDALSALGAASIRSFQLGRALFRAESALGNFDAALALQGKLRSEARSVPDLDPDDLRAMDLDEINLLLGAGRFVQGSQRIEAVLPRCEETIGREAQSCRGLFLKQAQTLLRLGEVERFARVFPRVLVMSQDSTLPFLQTEALILALRLVSIQPDLGNETELFERVREFGESGASVAIRPVFKSAALSALAEARLRAGDFASARGLAERSIEVLGADVAKGGGLQFAAIALTLKGVALVGGGHPDQALLPLQAAEEKSVRAYGSDHSATQLFALNTAIAWAHLHETDRAVALVKQAEPVLRVSLGAASPTYLQVQELLRTLQDGSFNYSTTGVPLFFR
jgi:eukaryotic-like serine/threonine-protein kinase